jgi:hypothetical protein
LAKATQQKEIDLIKMELEKLQDERDSILVQKVKENSIDTEKVKGNYFSGTLTTIDQSFVSDANQEREQIELDNSSIEEQTCESIDPSLNVREEEIKMSTPIKKTIKRSNDLRSYGFLVNKISEANIVTNECVTPPKRTEIKTKPIYSIFKKKSMKKSCMEPKLVNTNTTESDINAINQELSAISITGEWPEKMRPGNDKGLGSKSSSETNKVQINTDPT